MQKGEFIFVYGTLRQGQRMDLRRQAHEFNVKYIGFDRIAGRLYHLGAYPGLKRLSPVEVTAHTAQDKDGNLYYDETTPLVVGEVFFIRDAAISALLDAYEGYDADNPTEGLYDRMQVPTENGKTVWVYTYNPRVTSDQLIESGDWCKNPDIPVRQKMFG